MIQYDLQTTVEIDGKSYEINKKGDYRIILDILSAIGDEDLSERQKSEVALNIFYNFAVPDDKQTAMEEMLKFINLGENIEEDDNPPIMDWEKDFNLYAPPLRKVLGYEFRSPNEYTHWWTFVGGYLEIDGKSTFATVISIRGKLQKGKKLDEVEKEFYRKNRRLVDLKKRISRDDQNWLLGGE